MKIDSEKTDRPGTLKAWWYDPRNGGENPAGEFTNQTVQEFIPPAAAKAGEANDWVLVLDDSAKHYPPPGSADGRSRKARPVTRDVLTRGGGGGLRSIPEKKFHEFRATPSAEHLQAGLGGGGGKQVKTRVEQGCHP